MIATDDDWTTDNVTSTAYIPPRRPRMVFVAAYIGCSDIDVIELVPICHVRKGMRFTGYERVKNGVCIGMNVKVEPNRWELSPMRWRTCRGRGCLRPTGYFPRRGLPRPHRSPPTNNP
jgi:hypothetical protein